MHWTGGCDPASRRDGTWPRPPRQAEKVGRAFTRLATSTTESKARARAPVVTSGQTGSTREASGPSRGAHVRPRRSGAPRACPDASRLASIRRPPWRTSSGQDGSSRTIAAASLKGPAAAMATGLPSRLWRWRARGVRASPPIIQIMQGRASSSRPLHWTPSGCGLLYRNPAPHARKGRAGRDLRLLAAKENVHDEPSSSSARHT